MSFNVCILATFLCAFLPAEAAFESFPASLPLQVDDATGESVEPPPPPPPSHELRQSATFDAPLYRNISQFPGEDCNRVCYAGDRRACFFEFTLELYQAMGAACGDCARGKLADCEHPQCLVGDGIEKGVMSINRCVPGPAIQVCKGDVVVVDVRNSAVGSGATLHWHGLHMVETPYMDGVPFVTQCPIPFSTTFRYAFRATQPGTQFYHSHSGHHKVNGQYGALIVREPRSEDSHKDSYDYDLPEHYILISDWMHHSGEDMYTGLPSTALSPDAVLINGRGVYTHPVTKERTSVPATRYYVSPGKRYRFRIINSVSHACPFQLQIDNHNLTVIASDSFNLSPKTFDSIVSNGGERYDFVLTADQKSGDFWVRVQGLGFCINRPVESFALLRYIDESPYHEEEAVPPLPPVNQTLTEGICLNHPNATCWDTDLHHCITELNSTEQDDELRLKEPDHKFFLSFDNIRVPNGDIFQPGRYDHFVNLNGNVTIVSAINDLTLNMPPSPPLTQPEDVDEAHYCDSSRRPEHCQGRRPCGCIHRLKVPLNTIVEMILVDEVPTVGRIHHPFHMHGNRFMVTGIGRHPLGIPMTMPLVKQMERLRILPRVPSSQRPPFKDTVSIPSRGYAVIRLRANNPGFWLLHCHYEWHLTIGMALILQVGESREMVPTPKLFPKCGNYIPKVHI